MTSRSQKPGRHSLLEEAAREHTTFDRRMGLEKDGKDDDHAFFVCVRVCFTTITPMQKPGFSGAPVAVPGSPVFWPSSLLVPSQISYDFLFSSLLFS